MREYNKVIKIFFIGIIGLYSHWTFAFVEQVMTYQEKYKTSVGLFSTGGKFNESFDEDEMTLKGGGFFGEINLRRSPWSIRVDTYSTQRETGNQGLGVKNTYRELRAWGLGFYDVSEGYSLYAGLGSGLLFPETTMTVLGSSKSILGSTNVLGGVMVGMRWMMPIGIFADVWGQTIYAAIYPSGSISVFALALGYQF